MTKTCHTGGTWGSFGSLPPGSLLFPAHGSVQSEPRGWSDLDTLPDAPPPSTRAAADVEGSIYGEFYTSAFTTVQILPYFYL